MDVIWVKILILLALFASTLVFSLLPLKLVSAVQSSNSDTLLRRRYQWIFGCLNCFAAGVFLATCMLGLFPHVEAQMRAALEAGGIVTSFPLAQFIAFCGLFMVLMVEQFILTSQNHGHHSHAPNVSSSDDSRKPLLPNSDNSSSRRSPQSVNSNQSQRRECEKHADYKTESSHQTNQRRPSGHVQNRDDENGDLSFGDLTSADSGTEDESVIQHKTPQHQSSAALALIRSLVLLFALSLHSVFEGLAVGLQRDLSIVLQVFAALILHKSIIAFSLGVNLVRSNMKVSSVVRSNCIFAIASPVGIGVGIAVIDLIKNDTTSMLVNAILQAIASGTFLFVVFFEILPHEFVHESALKENRAGRCLKMLFLLLGYCTICVLILVLPNETKSHHVVP